MTSADRHRLLVIGGTGRVGSLVLPDLAAAHDVRVFDLRPPTVPVDGIDYVVGDATDYAAVRAAMTNCDTVVFMAMGPDADWDDPQIAATQFTVATTALYLALAAAADAGIAHAVYTSSMSVFEHDRAAPGQRPARWPDETVPPDSQHFYGMAKRFGEEICRSAVATRGTSVVALRLCRPTGVDHWPPPADCLDAVIHTSGRDVAAALLAAIAFRANGFEAFTISGDVRQTVTDLGKADRLLGWRPQDDSQPEAAG